MRYRALFLVVVGLLVCSLAYADIPRLINFQGRLTDASGKFVPDGNYSVTFRIYSVPSGGSALWTEAQLVSCTKGLFNVILGTVTPIPNTIFDSYVDTYLGIQVGADPEMTPRQRISSLGYAYYSLNADKLDGYHASDFTSPVSDFGRSGVSANLYEGTTALTDKYVNVAGPDSVYSTSGTAFLGKASGGSSLDMIGVKGLTENTSSGRAWGGYFGVATAGTGSQHYGVVGYSQSASDAVSYTSGVLGEGYANGSGWGIGIIGLANNSSSGQVYGGYFDAYSGGTGARYGIMANAYGSSAAITYGNYAYASNSSTGDVYGGYFTTSSSGTGYHYGVYGDVYGSSSYPVYGSYGIAENTGSGNTYGGYFQADSAGTGNHYGVRAYAYGDGTTDDAYGVYSQARNSSSANAYAGYFYTPSPGTGYHYGIVAEGYGYGPAAYGSYNAAYNYSDGEAYAGYFYASSSGSGTRYGVYSTSYSNSDSSTYGVYGRGYNYVTGDAYGGFFETSSSGTGYHYGVRAESYGSSSAPAYGSYCYAENTSSGSAYGGRFYTEDYGTGYHAGISASCYGSSTTYMDGVYSYADNTSSGTVYAGYFYASSSGTGAKRGIYAYAPTAEGYAGYFSGNTYTSGTKSSAAKLDNGEYRLLYAMESPENWFEDFGEGQLVNGRALVQIDPMFAQSVNTSVKYHVFLTPLDEPLTLAVANRTANSFEVRGPAGSDISFSYRIVAKRKGYEDIRMAKMIGPTPEEEEAMQAKRIADSEREMAQMKRERIERTEEDELKDKPKEPEMESVQKPRREEPRPEDMEKIRVKMESEK